MISGRFFRRTVPMLTLVGGLLLTAVGCKPTEKNYKAAYDAALAKRQTKIDADLGVPEEGLIVEGAPVRRTFDDTQVWYLVTSIGALDEGSLPPGRFNVATGAFKMPVNALDQARTLRGRGYESLAVRGENDLFYTVVSTEDSISGAVAFYKEFIDRNPEFTYVGLPSLTIIEKR